MDKVKSRFTKIGRPVRTFSTSNYDPSSPASKKRTKSMSSSEFLDSDHTPSPPHQLTYHGYMCVDDPKSNKDVLNALRTARGSLFKNMVVTLSHGQGTLRVAEGSGDAILVCPLHSVALVTHDASKGGYGDCLAIALGTGHYAKQCHAFQAKSSREAADIVQALQKASRSASKEKKVRKFTESGSAHQTKVSASESSKVRRPMQFMEDEDEIIEHKSIDSGRRESKKSIPALTHFPNEPTSSNAPSTSSSQLPPSDPLPPNKDRRKWKSGSRVENGEFTREDKVKQLVNAVERIQENNAFLRDKARRIITPSNIFEDSLYAMTTGNHDLLTNYVTQGNAVNSGDSGGNTLIHYAVALGQQHTVRLLCSNNAFLETAGWNDCKPIHRAIAEGHTHILQILLKHGAEVNSLDLMRRTPLHFSSAQMELMECSISLLEFGAHVMTSDLLGLRPFDLNPELKETLNRLVTSACETFVSAPLKDGGKEASPQEDTPESASPSTSPPASLDGLHGDDLNQLVDVVTRRAQVIASQAYARRKKFQKSMTHPYSRSHGNLVELLEGDEDEMLRKDRLKFPSDFNIDSTFHEMLQNREEALKAIRVLARASKEAQRSGGVVRSEDVERGELETSLSEPDLHREEPAVAENPPRPSSSAAILQDTRVMSLLGGNIVKFRADSGSSSGTLREGEDTDNDSLRLSRAFYILQEDLKRNSFQKSEDDLDNFGSSSNQLSRKMAPPQTTPLSQRRTKEETAAIFDDFLSQMEQATQSLHQNQTPLESRSNDSLDPDQNENETEEPSEMEARTQVAVTKRRVQSSDVPQRDGIRRPSSSASFNKGEGPPAEPPPRAASVEADMVFATLPKKKKKGRKWSRISSPLFKSRRRKSLQHATPTSSQVTSSHTSVTRPSPSVPLPPTKGKEASRSSPVSNSPRTTVQSVRTLVTRPSEEEEMGRDGRGLDSSGSSGRGLMGSRVRKRKRDECLNALKVMTTLSSNKECLSSLVSYICLPKCVSKLIEISQDEITTPQVLALISALLGNIFQSGGSEGKKTALGSGVLDLTIKLLQARDPIPGTCLSLLNQLLISEDDNDYLRTIIRIPTSPLLQYLEVCDLMKGGGGTEEDSGYENSSQRNRDTTLSVDTRSSCDAMSTTTDEGVGGLGGTSYLGLPPRHSGRSSSFNSETSESSGRSILSPSLPGPAHSDLDPRRIVLKMLAVSSSHAKMQLSLSTSRAVSLLVSCLGDLSQENVTNALITLANIAQNVGSHGLFREFGVVKKLQSVLSKGPRPHYHASRALVYLGQLEHLQGAGLFDPVATGYETDTIIRSTDSDGHTYARGATIEKCVELLTSEPSKLWGGFSLVVGPSGRDASGPSLNASKDQVLQFFLTTFKSFVHPLIFIRLLLHRLSLSDQENQTNLFDWSGKSPTSGSLSPTSHLVSVPPIETSILNLIGRWLELYPDDFTTYSHLRGEIDKVVMRLKLVRGPYIPHTHRIRSLLQDIERPRTEKVGEAAKEESRPPHHDNLYKLCQQMVTEGHLPVTLQQAIFMASLQLHLEDMSGVLSAPGTPVRNKRGTSKIKSAFPPGFSKSKSIMKRVKAQLAEFEKLSERNAKHLYIERCQANPGYDCAFFTVKVPSSGRFRRGPVVKQLMGINNKRIVFLDEKSKELIASHSLQSVLNVTRESDPCVLHINLRGDAAGFKVQVDSTTIAKEVANILEERREGEGMLDDSNLRWSDSVPSLFTMSIEKEPADTDSSSSTIDHTPSDRMATPPGHMLSYDMLKNPSPEGLLGATPPLGMPAGPEEVSTTPNGHMETLLTHKSDTLRAFAHDDSLVTDLADHLILSDSERLLFCDCPPDPELPPELNLKSLSLVDTLSCPLEVARQMTLIAHERFGQLSSTELLQKVNLLPKTPAQPQSGSVPASQRDSIVSTSTLRSSVVEPELQETAVEKLAYRFNQVGNWVTHSILQFEYLEERAEVIQQFIAIAKHCYDLGNYSSIMAIVVAGLGSAPIRRLHSSWAQVPKADMELFKEMDTLLDSRGNYKHYRDKLSSTELPAVPYVGVFLKDLTFICDGNPDYLRGGLINMHKRRQVYRLLEEIRHYQKDAYKLHTVPELRDYLLSHKPIPEDDLHSMSHSVEPSIKRSHSNSSTKSLSSVQNRSFFKPKGLTRSSSSGASYLNRTSATSIKGLN